MLPIHTGGTKGTVRSKFFQTWITLVIGQWSFRLFLFFFFNFRASPGPNSLREARNNVFCRLLASQSSVNNEHHVIFLSFLCNTIVMDFYCIKENRWISSQVRGTLEEREILRTNDTGTAKSREIEDEDRRKKERSCFARFLSFVRISRRFERPRHARMARLSNSFHSISFIFERWLAFLSVEAIYYFKWHCSYNIDRLLWKKFLQFLARI